MTYILFRRTTNVVSESLTEASQSVLERHERNATAVQYLRQLRSGSARPSPAQDAGTAAPRRGATVDGPQDDRYVLLYTIQGGQNKSL